MLTTVLSVAFIGLSHLQHTNNFVSLLLDPAFSFLYALPFLDSGVC